MPVAQTIPQMHPDARSILDQLARVDQERSRRIADPVLSDAVLAIKRYQRERFARTYADLLSAPRFSRAARFFLDELYGPQDFTQRDSQFARVVPALVRLFPADIVGTVGLLAELHALSEQLDSQMGAALAAPSIIDSRAYIDAWRSVGRREDRDRQIVLTVSIGRSLDRLTRKPLLRRSLHLMRGPARAAGLAALQAFLELGFDTFCDMGGAESFLDLVEQRERILCRLLFDVSDSSALELMRLLP